jgi:metacaspase-1
MSYPGQGNHTYGNYRPPNYPPNTQQQYGNYGNYGPPSGPPPGPRPQGYNSYGPPPGPPPGSPQGISPRPNYDNRPSGYGSPQPGFAQVNDSRYATPSFQPQSFGVQGIQPFQYSNCQGKRKALCIGINYFGSKNQLRGCINDARAVSAFLQDRFGYKEEDMVVLTDDQRDPRSIPTRANIIKAMHWLVAGAQTNDTLFLHYSGHGGQTKDLDGDEDDGFDEVIYPVDFQQAGHIVDDEIHDIMVKPLMPGVRLTGLFDSCHSGTVMDLPFLYSTKGALKEPNLAKDAGEGLLGAFTSYERGDIGGMISTVSGVFTKATRGNQATQLSRRIKASPADVIQISGCKDDQTSADAVEAGTNTGAMSYSFIEVMSHNPNQSYISLLNEMRNVMRGRYTQKPQLSVSISATAVEFLS